MTNDAVLFLQELSVEEQAEIRLFDDANYEAFLAYFHEEAKEVPADGVTGQG